MSHEREQLLAMLQEADAMAYGSARTRLVEDVVRHADAQGFTDLQFTARMELTAAYEFGGETAKTFVPFSWCLAAYDRDPGGHTPAQHYHLLWRFKWIVTAMTLFPQITLAQTNRMLDDMERRYREGGHGLQPVHALRCRVAHHVGDLPAAAEWYRMWCTTPRGQFSDCEACDVASRIGYLATDHRDTARDAEVVAAAEPVVGGGLGCELQPQSLHAVLLLPQLRLGDHDAARDSHRWYRKVRDNVKYLDSMARHVEFCALSGNEARGLEILERHLGWYDRPPDTAALMSAATAATLLLQRLCDTGRGGVTLHRPRHGDRPAGAVEVAALAAEMRATATGLAEQFDARNGTSWQSTLVRDRLALVPYVDHLPLSPTVRRRPPPPPASAAPPAPADDLAGRTPEELLDVADRQLAARQAAAAAAAWHRYDEVAGDDVDPLLTARRIDGRGLEAARGDDLAAAEAHWRDAADRYRSAGDEVRRQAVLGRLGQIMFLTRRADEGLPLVVASADHLRTHGSDELRCNAELRLARVRHHTGDTAEALAALARADAAATTTAQRGDVHLERALLLGHTGDQQTAAVAEAHAAREAYRAAGVPEELGRASFLHAKLLEETDPQAAIAAYDEAVANAHASEPILLAQVRASRGVLLTGTGQHDDAIDDLIEAVAVFTEQGAPHATYARFDLAVAYRDAGRLFDAAEVAEEAVTALAATDDTETTERCRYLLAHLYRGLTENDQALIQLDLLAEAFETTDRLPAAAQMHEEAGEVLDTLDRDAAAAARFDTAAGMFAETGQVSDEVRCRRRQALALHWAGDSEAGLAALTGANTTLDGLPDDIPAAAVAWERAANDYTAARILLYLERHDEASARARQAVTGFEQAGADDDMARAATLVTDIDEARQTAAQEDSDNEP